MSVAVVIPWRGGCPHRQRAWHWVRGQYRRHFPDWRIVLAPSPSGPWVKARAVNPAIAALTDAEIIILADADVWCDGVGEAVEAVRGGELWAVPHRGVHRLSKEGTAAVLEGQSWRQQPLAERSHSGVVGGGLVVGRRDVFLSVPLDPRFVGWGQEDESFGLALFCLIGRPWRGKSPLVHLWHPSQPRLSRKWGNAEGKKLQLRYRKARRDPNAMMSLISEAQ